MSCLVDTVQRTIPIASSLYAAIPRHFARKVARLSNSGVRLRISMQCCRLCSNRTKNMCNNRVNLPQFVILSFPFFGGSINRIVGLGIIYNGSCTHPPPEGPRRQYTRVIEGGPSVHNYSSHDRNQRSPLTWLAYVRSCGF